MVRHEKSKNNLAKKTNSTNIATLCELNDCVFQGNETKLIKFPSYSKLTNEDNFLKLINLYERKN